MHKENPQTMRKNDPIKLNHALGKQQTRTFTIDVVGQSDTGNVEMSISSETPYLRSYGYEVLSHAPGALDDTRLKACAPVLWNHNPDAQCGAVRDFAIVDRVGRATVEFSNNSALGKEVGGDVRDGIRKNVSIGYIVHEWDNPATRPEIDGVPVYTAVKWECYEMSIVSIPADITVGVGRSADTDDDDDEEQDEDAQDDGENPDLDDAEMKKDDDEEDNEDDEDESKDDSKRNRNSESAILITKTSDNTESGNDSQSLNLTNDNQLAPTTHEGSTENSSMDEKKVTVTADHDAVKRNVEKITELCVREGMTDKLATYLGEGRSFESVAAEWADAQSRKSKPVTKTAITDKDVEKVSFRDGLDAFMKGGNSALAEMGLEAAKRSGLPVNPNALYIPTSAPLFKRTINTAGNGSQFITTQYASFEDVLREQTVLGRLGVEISEGIKQTVTMPRQLNAVPTAWVGENTSINVSEGTYDSVQWSPKTLATAVPFTRQAAMMNGVYDVETIVRNDIMASFLEQAEKAVFSASGSLQPLGLLNDGSIPSSSIASGSVSAARFAKLAQIQRENKGSQNGVAYVVTPGIYNAASLTPAFAGATFPMLQEGKFITNDAPVIQSNFMPYSGGVHSMIYGDFSKVHVVHFGVLELIKDEFTLAGNGAIVLRGFMYMDSKVRQPKALVTDSLVTVS